MYVYSVIHPTTKVVGFLANLLCDKRINKNKKE